MDGDATGLLPTSKAARVIGVSANTLRAYANAGRIRYELTPGGQRRYDVRTIQSKQARLKATCKPQRRKRPRELCTAESLPKNKKTTSGVKSKRCKRASQATKSSRTSRRASTTIAKASRGFWSERKAELSTKLWWPTATVSRDSAWNSSSGPCVVQTPGILDLYEHSFKKTLPFEKPKVFGYTDTPEGPQRLQRTTTSFKKTAADALHGIAPKNHYLAVAMLMEVPPGTKTQNFHRDIPYDACVVDGYIQRKKSSRRPFGLPQLHVAIHNQTKEMGGIEFERGGTLPCLKAGDGVFFDGNSDIHRGLANESKHSRWNLVFVWLPNRLKNNQPVQELLNYFYST